MYPGEINDICTHEKNIVLKPFNTSNVNITPVQFIQSYKSKSI